MQTIYRLKAQEISMALLKSLKTMFAGHDIEITVKSVEPVNGISKKDKAQLLQMVEENRVNAPVIDPTVDIRTLIDESHNPPE